MILRQNRYTSIDDLAGAMTQEEYAKAKEFYSFLVEISKCNNGVLHIERDKFINLASVMMKCTTIEAHSILRKMQRYGWIATIDEHFVIVNVANSA